MSILISIAIGKRAEAEASRLAALVPELKIVTDEDADYVPAFDDPQLNGLATKCGFGEFLQQAYDDEDVFLLDADLFPTQPEPFVGFPRPDADVAFVPYPGRRHFPDNERQSAVDVFDGVFPNTGLVWFASAQIARAFSTKWKERYIQRLTDGPDAIARRRWELDESAFLIELAESGLRVAYLGSEWNDWNNEHPDPIIRHEHIVVEPIDPNVKGVTVQGITLAAGESDQLALVSLLTLLREAENLLPDEATKAAFRAAPRTITDVQGKVHTLPDLRSLRELAVAYGTAILEQWTIHAKASAAIRAADKREQPAKPRD